MKGHLPIVVALVFSTAASGQAQPADDLLDRTLAIVGGRAVTLSDLRAATALGLIEGGANQEAATEQLVERTLVLREVERYVPPEPQEAAIDERLSDIRASLTEQEFNEALAAGGFTPARLRAWVRDDLRIAAYLEQRFAAAADVSVEQLAPELRERMSAERRAALIEDWIADLRRRTPVVELWRRAQ